MKALVRHAYGSTDELRIERLRKPTPGDDELLLRIRAVSLNLGDWELLTGKPLFISVLATLFGRPPRYEPLPREEGGPPPPSGGGPFKPRHKILGTDIAGEVEAVGRNVTRFRPGDEVFGMTMFGGLAEYRCVTEKAELTKKPAGISFEDAAAIPQAAFIAMQGIENRRQVGPGRKVLVNGAGGGAGSFAVQLAKLEGAEVTGVDNGRKLEMMRSIGADHVVDYTSEDYTKRGESYDLILDLAAHRSIFDNTRILKPGGAYLLAGGAFGPTLQAGLLGPLLSRFGSKQVIFLLAAWNEDELIRMTELSAAGSVRPIVDRVFPLEEAVEAFRRVGEGRSLGKVVITL